MSKFLFRALPVVAICLLSSGCTVPAQAAPTATKLVQVDGKWQLMRDGKPYLVKGAGGDGDKVALKATGANSFRTWGSDNLEKKLDEAQKLGLSVTVGIWLGHKEHGFSYDDPKAVADQFEMAKAAILRYKDHPAVLMWGIGNEMEGYEGTTSPKMWQAVQQIAKFAHEVDPNHPTMTITAEIGGDRVASLHKYCPDIDIYGINSYAGSQSLPERYKKEGGTKPYIITEFGPPGTWEQGKNSWGAVAEPTSTAKADWYRGTWDKAIKTQPLALGGYAFTWGNKQEASATWFGMLLHDGTRLGPVDALQEEWTGKYPTNRVPEITSMKVEGADKTKPDGIIKASLATLDHEKDPIKVNWVLQYDPMIDAVGGETQASPPTFPEAIQSSTNDEITLKMPNYGGAYRLFAFVYDGKGGGAVGNIPLYVEGGDKSPNLPARKVDLPFELYGEDQEDHPYIPSGYMGNTGAIKMGDTTVNPHSGKSALKVDYTANDNWGGVVWQSPANDWGSVPGGFNLTGAKKLTFWARGDKGGEVVSFSYGLIGADKPYHDTGKGELAKVVLTKDWKQYEINLEGQDLSRIKTGFCWVVGGSGAPITFYLDDIKFESGKVAGLIAKTAGDTPNAPNPAPANTDGAPKAAAKKGKLPLALISDEGGDAPYIPSGYMGNTGAIAMSDSTDNPHTGKSSTKVQYKAADQWGGVVWQSPANDWGNVPGGFDLTGAKKLTFWARGATGGEEVSFSFGLIGADKPYHDTAKGELSKVKLTADWKQYTIDLAGKDLSSVKTGFCWVVGGTGQPVTFYLDDLKYE